MKVIEMCLKDLEEVTRIENENFDEPWPQEAFVRDMDNKYADLICLKSDNNELIGYYDVWYMMENADISNIVVDKKYQGNKYGEYLLNDLINRCKEKEVEYLHLEVKVDNKKAYNLYKKFGFEEVRVRKGYYQGVDGIDMLKGLKS